MKETFGKVEDLAGHVQEYVNNQIDTIKLNTAEKGAKLMTSTLTMTVCLFIFGVFTLFISLALAFALAKATGEMYWGFLIVSGIYLLVGILVYVQREKFLKLPIMNYLLKQIFKGDGDEDQQY